MIFSSNNLRFLLDNPIFQHKHSYLFAFILSLLLVGCGGDESPTEDEETVADSSAESLDSVPESFDEEPVVPPPPNKKKQDAPNPNGVFLPIYEITEEKQELTKQNDQPVYSNGKYFLWFNGAQWKISTQAGGGRVLVSGGEKITDSWPESVTLRHSPDEEYAKQALFRLAVAYQGSEDNENAVRLFEQYVRLFPEDKSVAEAYLSLGDLIISQVGSDNEPNFEQINKARNFYSMVLQKTQEISLITDSINNEGGLIERVAENPEGLVNFFLSFDQDSDGKMSKTEFSGAVEKMSGEEIGDFTTHEQSGDGKIDFDELYEMASLFYYKQLHQIYSNYVEKFGGVEGVQVARATEKIGFALEKQGSPSQMLELYFSDISKYGNDPSSIGVDGILKKYREKYDEYSKLYGLTLDILKKIQNPSDPVSFVYRNRQGIEEEMTGTVEEMIKDRKKVLAMLGAQYSGMDPKIYSDIVKYRGAIFLNPDYAAKFQGYLKKYQNLFDKFPQELSPEKAFVRLLREAIDGGKKTLELRMRANLDQIGSRAGGDYNPQTNEFPAASAGVLIWMAEKMIAQNSINDAVAAMERLVDLYGDVGGDFLFDAHYLIGKAKEKERDYLTAANHFDAALSNSTWHANSNDARIRRGNALYEIAEKNKDPELFSRAKSSFDEVRGDTEAPLELRAQSAFMMGECLKSVKDYTGAAFLFFETTLNFPSAVKWAPKAFEQAIRCYEQSGQMDQLSKVEKQYIDWQRKFLK
jgi:tetratricopeptide (TPR) repeat protein